MMPKPIKIMRRRFFLSAILMLSFCCCSSQTLESKNALNISLGLSLPVGAYAKTDITNSSSGVANTGEVVKVAYTHLVSKSFGLSLAIHGQRNPLHTKAFEESLSQSDFYQSVFFSSTTNPSPTQIPSGKYGNWKVDKASWLLGALLAGGYAQVYPGSSDKLLLTAKAMLGVAYVHTPELNAKSSSDTALVQITQNDGSAPGFAYSIAGGFKLKCSGRIYLLSQVEYFGTGNIMFKDIKSTITAAHYQNGSPASLSMQTATGNGKQKIAAINLNIGIGINL